MLVVCLMAVSTPMAALAAAQDYAFEAVKTEVRNGPGSDIAVRLVHKPSGKPVEDAVIFRTRLDMSPENMEGMTTKIEPLTESEPGVYKFRADFTMAGGWALKLQAKVQGEPETVQGTVVFTAKD
ncbi:MAG: FixH family protein [Hyphomicrobium sp.]|nr:FixH family protein [Hyphomicrobium sp.]